MIKPSVKDAIHSWLTPHLDRVHPASPQRQRNDNNSQRGRGNNTGHGLSTSDVADIGRRGSGIGHGRPITNMSNIKTVSAFSIPGSIEWLPVNFFVDSGSSILLVSDEFFKQLQQSDKSLILNKCDTVALSVTDDKLDILGKVELELQLYGLMRADAFVEYKQTFHVIKGIMYKCLLGLDFLQAYSAMIDVDEHFISLTNADVVVMHKMHELPDHNSIFNVYASTDIVIDKRCQTVFAASLEQRGSNIIFENWGENDETNTIAGIFTPSVLIVDMRLVGASVVSNVSNSTVIVQLMNIANEPIMICSGKKLGDFEIIDEIDSTAIMTDIEHNDMYNVINVSGVRFDSKSNNNDVDCVDTKVNDDFAILDTVDIGRDNVSATHRAQLLNVLRKKIRAFVKHKRDYGRTHLIKHTIDTGDTPPVRSGLQRMSPPQREIVEKQIKEMLEDGVIKPSTGPYSSPIVLVKKKSGDIRFCVDSRRLNNLTIRDVYPLPRLDDALHSLHNAHYFSSLDLQAGYWQIELDPIDKHRTAFVMHCGLYQFTVMAFGLCNAPSCFQKLMDCVLSNLNYKDCLVYLDDVIVFGETPEEHTQRLDWLLQRFIDAGLKLNLEKCHFLQQQVEYLGHIISSEGLAPSPSKVKAVLDYPRPSTPKQVRAFLGLISFYRRYVKQFSTVASPLYALTEKGKVFDWNADHENAFNALKKMFAKDVVLVFPNFKQQFQVTTDVSGIGLGAVLS